MAKKKKRDKVGRPRDQKPAPDDGGMRHGLHKETLHGVFAIGFFVVAIFLTLAAFDKAGVIGTKLYQWLGFLLGVGYALLPILFFMLGASFIRTVKTELALTKTIGAVLFVGAGLGIIETLFPSAGGFIGGIISRPLVALIDFYATLIFLSALFIISLLIVFNAPLSFMSWFKKHNEEEEGADAESEIIEPMIVSGPAQVEESNMEKFAGALKSVGKEKGGAEETLSVAPMARFTGAPYNPPPLSLLERDRGKPGVGDIKANANIIKRTLQNFGIDVEMDEISIGPSVTRYALKPAEGVLLSKILGLQKNLELALAAHPVRIEAPIPGKSLVGIEIPNSTKTTVGLASLLGLEDFVQTTKLLPISLGRDVSGNATFADLAKMPHMLIAGATGSGKSVTIHTMINSLIFKNSPETLKFVLIDPKRVEMTMYNGIPHLLTPVITDPKKAILALKWLINEMSRRYNILESHSVRDIHSYHTNVLLAAVESARKSKDATELPETMPYIVVIIDELADIMSTYPRELEASIVRLAQMSRAIGIHLMLSTQRPSVNVITGLIKANIPARVALQVSSQIDSRTILDMSGAEKLLGAGDMLFMSGDMAKPKRIQSAFISEEEVKKVVGYLKKNYGGEVPSDMELAISSTGDGVGATGFDDADDDELYEDARATVMQAGKASTSYLQRKLRVGYARAARLMDILEERGVIGPADGSKPRDVIGASPEGGGVPDEDLF